MHVSFPADRASALARLDEFLTLAPRYAAERNFVYPGHAQVSRLSPAIRHRLITEEEVVAAVLKHHAFSRVEKFLQEVVWRTYWKGWLENRPQVWSAYEGGLKRRNKELGAEARSRLVDLAAGRSPSGIMNHFSRELVATGYLHNHARMWWASYWIHHLQLPWELGAAHFMAHLLDADPASNTLSWRWVAGLQTRGKAYVARSENIAKFCAPELIGAAGGIGLGEVGAVAVDFDAANELLPPVDPGTNLVAELPPTLPEGALLLHDDDLSPETSLLGQLRPKMLLHYLPPEVESPTQSAWRQVARADAVQRVEQHFAAPLQVCASVAEIGRQCRQNGVRALVLLEPFVGPRQTQLAALEAVLSPDGIEVVRVRRSWDARLFPYARKGFFPFWDKIGGRLRKHGLEGLR